MKEFEQALHRARTVPESEPKPESFHRTPLSSERPHSDPKIDGVTDTVGPGLAEALSQTDFDRPTAPGLPILQADFEGFQKNLGGGQDNQEMSGSFRLLRTQMLLAMEERGGRVLGITSATPGAGKTVTAIELAFACARLAEQRVALADFDFRRPMIARYLTAENHINCIPYFRGEGRIEDYLTRNEQGNLVFMLTDRPTELSAEYLASSRMDQALAELSSHDGDGIVIVDLPPLVGCDDTLAILPKLDALLFVVAAGETRFGQVQEAIDLIPRDKLIATVLNKSGGKPPYYGYGQYGDAPQ